MIANESSAPVYPFTLLPLKFGDGEISPFQDPETLRVHRGSIHSSLVAALNELIKDEPALHGRTVEDLLRGIQESPSRLRSTLLEAAGAHANHQFFWKILGRGTAPHPSGSLAAAIESDFGSFAAFQDLFARAALSLDGDGWVFLVVDPTRDGRLGVHAGPGNESVLTRGTPGLLICDLWRHAYQDGFGSRREDYLEEFWKVVDWDAVGRRLEGIRSGRRQL